MSKTVIDMAQSVGATRYTNRHYPDRPTYTFFVDQLERLVELVRADERAKLAEQPAPAAPVQQEPVAWMQDSIELYVQDRPGASYTIPLYTTPQAQPAREWAGMTDEEFQWIYDHGRTPAGMMEMVEAKLKEKNT